MRKISDLKVFLLDRNPEMVEAWEKQFKRIKNVEVVCSDFAPFMDSTFVETIVSPGNSYGLMDGGYDKAIIDHFGPELQEKVQQKILQDWGGEQTPGTSLFVDMLDLGQRIIHSPTMRIPSVVDDPWVVEKCTRTALAVALNSGVLSIVLPGFCAGTGGVDPKAVAWMMRYAYDRLVNLPEKIDWDYAFSFGELA